MSLTADLEKPTNKRSWFRLEYPQELMPSIVIGTLEFAIPEISERGFRIRCREFSEFGVGDEIKGTIYFTDGSSMTLTSAVFRRDQQDIVFRPLKSIPFRRVIAEQRRVIRLANR